MRISADLGRSPKSSHLSPTVAAATSVLAVGYTRMWPTWTQCKTIRRQSHDTDFYWRICRRNPSRRAGTNDPIQGRPIWRGAQIFVNLLSRRFTALRHGDGCSQLKKARTRHNLLTVTFIQTKSSTHYVTTSAFTMAPLFQFHQPNKVFSNAYSQTRGNITTFRRSVRCCILVTAAGEAEIGNFNN